VDAACVYVEVSVEGYEPGLSLRLAASLEEEMLNRDASIRPSQMKQHCICCL
jgi:hypothetical protein